jgi:uncharacterized repeat protein (TIGR01451 family)
MNSQLTSAPSSHRANRSSLTRIAALVALVTLIGIPLFSSSLASSASEKSRTMPQVRNEGATVKSNSTFGKFLKARKQRGLLPFLLPPETIETFAADCLTPKSAFTLGETVCAITNDVDLGFPGGRWVHWLRQDLSIAHGSSTTTLITTNPQVFTFTPDQVGSWKVTIAETGDISQTPAIFTVALGPESIATYESTCAFAQDNFTLVGGTVTVCAKADPNFSGDRFIFWVNAQGETFDADIVTSTTATSSTAITQSGNYWVYFSDSDGSLRNKHAFSVSDPGAPKVDLSVFKTLVSGDVIAGGFVSYEIVVGNRGPDTAGTVELTDTVPLNTTYSSSTQDAGPSFTRTQETPITKWEIASLQAGASATFTFVYQVVGGTPVGTVIANTADVTSATAEIHTQDNTGSAFGTVVSGTPAGECTLDCPNNIVTTATTHGAGGGANVTFGAAEGFGTCGTITSSPTSGSFFPIGTTTVINTSATGGGGCSFTVTVVDSAAPTITCPANITVTANAGDSQAFVPDPNGGSSNVGTPATTGDAPLDVTGSREDGEGLTTAYPIGVTNITWLATDPSGRQATCTQRITVIPNQILTITCPANVNVNSPTGCSPATVNPGTPTSNSQTATILGRRDDNLAYSNSPEFNDPFPIGTTTITWTATDTDTQSASCTQTVTVTGTDTTPPTLTVPPNISTTTSTCTVTLDDELGVATAEDDCGTVNISRTGVPTFACPTPQDPNKQCESFVFPTGTTIITYTATNSSGLSTTGTQTVTVTESPAINPTITAPADVTLYTGAGATSCSVAVSNLDAALGTATASDNCPGVTVARSGVPGGNVFPLGNTTITYTATDKSGNIATDTQVVTVVDNTPPVVTAPAPVTLYTGPGATSCSVTVSNLDGTLGTGSATDNCSGVGAVSRSGVPAGNIFPVGTTTVTYSATDAHGNTGSATQVVTVVDNTQPIISCPANITLEPTCPTGAIATYSTPTATDNCGVQSVTRNAGSLASGSVFPVGTSTVTHTATDIYGNQSSCSFTVTVLTPQAVIQNLIASVSASSLTGTQKNGLLSKLNAALSAINNGQQNIACNKLSEFVNNVGNLITQGSLTAAQGNAWISSANHVRNYLGCTNLPCS